MIIKPLYYILFIVMILSCKGKGLLQKEPENIDALAREYVKLALDIGQYDKVFVDAYYGPDSLKPKEMEDVFLKDSVINEIYYLIARVKDAENAAANDTIKNSAGWLMEQLLAFAKRVNIFTKD